MPRAPAELQTELMLPTALDTMLTTPRELIKPTAPTAPTAPANLAYLILSQLAKVLLPPIVFELSRSLSTRGSSLSMNWLDLHFGNHNVILSLTQCVRAVRTGSV